MLRQTAMASSAATRPELQAEEARKDVDKRI
jgi:hypothetical protein